MVTKARDFRFEIPVVIFTRIPGNVDLIFLISSGHGVLETELIGFKVSSDNTNMADPFPL